MRKNPIYYLIGHPLSHSYSGIIHRAISKFSGEDCEYIIKDIEEKDLPEFVSFVKENNVRGFNITIPYKEKIIPFLDDISEDAKEMGACNTVLAENGRLYGFNTDGEGFLSALALKNAKIIGANAAIIGCGGAAKAVAHALLSAGATSVTVFARDFGKALALCKKQINKTHPVELAKWGEFSGCFNLLVNATPVGMFPKEGVSPIEDFSPLKKDALVCDLIYNPDKTKFLSDAAALGFFTQNGLPMLIYQAILARSIWSSGGNFSKIFGDVYEEIKNQLYS